jgi:CubicO group peptidase (beta-lactamase class C family)
MISRLLPLAFIAATWCTACRSESHNFDASRAAALRERVSTTLDAAGVPGWAIEIVQDGRVVAQWVHGLARVETRDSVTSSTPFQLASTTKTFAAAATLLAVADGKLRLDDRLGSLLDDMPPSWSDVTVRQLLSHTTGLPDIVVVPGQLALIASTWDSAYAAIRNAPLPAPHGTRWAYNQTNYALLKRILESRTGRPFEEYVHERLFEPLGMRSTFYPSATRSCAVNYEVSRGTPPRVRDLSFPGFVHTAGGLCSSLDDLIRWNAALDSGRVLPDSLTRVMWTPAHLTNGDVARVDGKRKGYGLGWVVDETPGRRSVSHSGGNSTAYLRLIDQRATIIVLHNGVSSPEDIVSMIEDALVGGDAADASAEERLWDGAIAGDTTAVLAAIAQGADVNALDTRRSPNGRRALNWAAQNDHAAVARILLAHGAGIDSANVTGFTALHHAAESGAVRTAELLLQSGANAALTTKAGETARSVAERKNHADVVALIDRFSRR